MGLADWVTGQKGWFCAGRVRLGWRETILSRNFKFFLMKIVSRMIRKII